MYGDAPVHEVFEGIGDMVDQALAQVHSARGVDRMARTGVRA
jgi:hypothetical protein